MPRRDHSEDWTESRDIALDRVPELAEGGEITDGVSLTGLTYYFAIRKGGEAPNPGTSP